MNVKWNDRARIPFFKTPNLAFQNLPVQSFKDLWNTGIPYDNQLRYIQLLFFFYFVR